MFNLKFNCIIYYLISENQFNDSFYCVFNWFFFFKEIITNFSKFLYKLELIFKDKIN